MRRLLFPLVLTFALSAIACTRSASGPIATDAPGSDEVPSVTATPSVSDEPSSTGTPSPSPAEVPDGVPASFDEDVAGRDLPVEELIPPGDEVTGVDRSKTSGGEAVVIVFTTPGGDPFSQARGFVVWRREPGADPAWRAVYGIAHGRRDGVLAIAVDVTDLTGDASADALVREETGGTGACATYRVVDLAAGVPLWKRSVCDAEIQPNPDPIGLREVARVYGPDDPHCCPSAIRERVLAWSGDRFAVVFNEVTPL